MTPPDHIVITDEVPQLPEDLSAVCLDANAMSRGQLNLSVLEELVEVIDAQELDVSVLVPETVLWEWGEHLAAEITTASSVVHKLQQLASNAGVALVPEHWASQVTTDAVVDAVTASVNDIDGVDVLSLSSSAIAIEALRDQILLRSPARKKKDVKTGAADSATFRLIEAEHARVGGTFLVVSIDQDAKAYFDRKPDLLLTISISRAKAGIIAMRTGTEIAVERFHETVSLRLPRMMSKELGAAVVGPENAPTAEYGRSLRGVRILNLTYELVAIQSVTSITDVEVSRNDGYAAAVVDAVVRIKRDLQVLTDHSENVDMDIDIFDGLPATLEVSAESDNGVDWDLMVDRVRLT